ncbi:hypothetical protein, partial [Pseudomonas aeruginosa]|uniref:hypothetical protein n=1 Tax=Pseudomonas aeruginosa TaxID=287 RepID=UPI00330728BF
GGQHLVLGEDLHHRLAPVLQEGERTGFHHQRPEPLVWILIALQECEGEVIALTCSPTSVPR